MTRQYSMHKRFFKNVEDSIDDDKVGQIASTFISLRIAFDSHAESSHPIPSVSDDELIYLSASLNNLNFSKLRWNLLENHEIKPLELALRIKRVRYLKYDKNLIVFVIPPFVHQFNAVAETANTATNP